MDAIGSHHTLLASGVPSDDGPAQKNLLGWPILPRNGIVCGQRRLSLWEQTKTDKLQRRIQTRIHAHRTACPRESGMATHTARLLWDASLWRRRTKTDTAVDTHAHKSHTKPPIHRGADRKGIFALHRIDRMVQLNLRRSECLSGDSKQRQTNRQTVQCPLPSWRVWTYPLNSTLVSAKTMQKQSTTKTNKYEIRQGSKTLK